jgi:hypothetical protein
MNKDWIEVTTLLPEMHLNQTQTALFSNYVVEFSKEAYVGRFVKDLKSSNSKYRLSYFQVVCYGEIVVFAIDLSQLEILPNHRHCEFAGMLTHWIPLPSLPII